MQRRHWPAADGDLVQAQRAAIAKSDRVVQRLKADGHRLVTKAEFLALLDGIEAQHPATKWQLDVLRDVAEGRCYGGQPHG